MMIVAKDNFYEPKEFTGPGGQKIALKSTTRVLASTTRDRRPEGADGKEIQTSLLPANQSETLEFSLPAGTYELFCSVHPIEMRGKMTLS
jgi:plastocyanin